MIDSFLVGMALNIVLILWGGFCTIYAFLRVAGPEPIPSSRRIALFVVGLSGSLLIGMSALSLLGRGGCF